MAEDLALALLQALREEDGQSMARIAKRLGVGQSALLRVLAALGAGSQTGGLDLVTREDVGGRALLRLTDAGRALCTGR